MKKLIVITTPFFFESEERLLVRLMDAGLQQLHIRKPEANIHQIEHFLDRIPCCYYPNIVLHDAFQLAQQRGLGGIHLNRRNSTVPIGFRGTVSRSCHSIEELKQYQTLDYLFLSPIFQSISKEGYGNGFDAKQLQSASEKGIINDKTIALGGISLETIPKLRPYSFGGVAVLGALWGQHPTGNQETSILKTFQALYTYNKY